MTYHFATYTLTVPSVDNDGNPVPYLEKVRAGLEEAGFSGWTETPSVGYWKGVFEPGTVITIYAPRSSATFKRLGNIGRYAMPDQEAVQVTVGADVVLAEA